MNRCTPTGDEYSRFCDPDVSDSDEFLLVSNNLYDEPSFRASSADKQRAWRRLA